MFLPLVEECFLLDKEKNDLKPPKKDLCFLMEYFEPNLRFGTKSKHLRVLSVPTKLT